MKGREQDRTEQENETEKKLLLDEVGAKFKRLSYKLDRGGELPLRQGHVFLTSINEKIKSYNNFITEAEKAILKLPQDDQEASRNNLERMKTQIKVLEDAAEEFENTPYGYFDTSKHFQVRKDNSIDKLKGQVEVIKSVPDAIKKIKSEIKDKTKALVASITEEIARDQNLSGASKGALRKAVIAAMGKNKCSKIEKEELRVLLVDAMSKSRHPKALAESIVKAALSPGTISLDGMKADENPNPSIEFIAELAGALIAEKRPTVHYGMLINAKSENDLLALKIATNDKIDDIQEKAMKESWAVSKKKEEIEKIRRKQGEDINKINILKFASSLSTMLMEYKGVLDNFIESTKNPISILKNRLNRINAALSERGIDVSDALRRCMDTVTPPGEEKYPDESRRGRGLQLSLSSLMRPSARSSRADGSFASQSVRPSSSESPSKQNRARRERSSSFGHVLRPLESFRSRRKLTTRPLSVDKTNTNDDSSKRKDGDDESHKRKPSK